MVCGVVMVVMVVMVVIVSWLSWLSWLLWAGADSERGRRTKGGREAGGQARTGTDRHRHMCKHRRWLQDGPYQVCVWLSITIIIISRVKAAFHLVVRS